MSPDVSGPLPATISEVLDNLNRSGRGIFVALESSGKIQGIVTDGDVRRAMLAGSTLASSPLPFLNRSPLSRPDSSSKAERQSAMRKAGVRHLLLVSDSGALAGTEALISYGTEKDNWVIIMAGGLGQRMHPHTLKTPKPMLKVRGQPILELIIEKLAGQGFRNFAISVNYLSEQIEGFFGDGSSRGLQITYVRESEPLGTAGSLGLFDVDTSDPVLVVNGDVLTDADFEEMTVAHGRAHARCTIGLKQVVFQNPYGVVRIDDSRVVGYEEKPETVSLVSAGVYVFDHTVFRELVSGESLDMPELVMRLINDGQIVHGFPVVESWLDVGRPDDFYAAGGGE